MSTLFVADIHLCEQEPTIIAGFLHFLNTRARLAKALYILGDLYEFWIGDDDPNPLHEEIAASLRALNKNGVPCYFIHGNHDFLLGKQYANSCSMTLLPEHQVLQLDGQRIVILHGDTLCTTDTNYQYFRKWVHQRWLQQLFLYLPLSIRLQIANRIRTNISKSINIIDVNFQAIMVMMKQTGATMMIHGHTHQPAIHHFVKKYYRAVLGNWCQQGSAIEVNSKGITLINFPFNKNS